MDAGEVQPTPVEVTNADPLPVAVVPLHPGDHDSPAQSAARRVAVGARVAANKSRVDDQQRISGMWESTQRLIAIAVVLDVLGVSTLVVLIPAFLLVIGRPIDEAAKAAAVGGLLFLTSTSSLVIGFYFGRTNHQRVGGDPTPNEDSLGR